MGAARFVSTLFCGKPCVSFLDFVGFILDFLDNNAIIEQETSTHIISKGLIPWKAEA